MAPNPNIFKHQAPWSEMGILCFDRPTNSPVEFEISLGGKDDPEGDFPGVHPVGGELHQFICHPPYCILRKNAVGIFVYENMEVRK